MQFKNKRAIPLHSITENKSMQIRVIYQHRSLMPDKLHFCYLKPLTRCTKSAINYRCHSDRLFDTCSSWLATNALLYLHNSHLNLCGTWLWCAVPYLWVLFWVAFKYGVVLWENNTEVIVFWKLFFSKTFITNKDKVNCCLCIKYQYRETFWFTQAQADPGRGSTGRAPTLELLTCL